MHQINEQLSSIECVEIVVKLQIKMTKSHPKCVQDRAIHEKKIDVHKC